VRRRLHAVRVETRSSGNGPHQRNSAPASFSARIRPYRRGREFFTPSPRITGRNARRLLPLGPARRSSPPPSRRRRHDRQRRRRTRDSNTRLHPHPTSMTDAVRPRFECKSERLGRGILGVPLQCREPASRFRKPARRRKDGHGPCPSIAAISFQWRLVEPRLRAHHHDPDRRPT